MADQSNGAIEMNVVNLQEKLDSFSDYWSPKLVGELNGQHVRLVKLQGEFIWHHHEHEDELFLVLSGQLKMLYRDGTNGLEGDRQVVVNPGEFVIVPKGVEHKPVADEEVHVMLLEPASTLNTGNVQNERTVATLTTL
jgi:mannose-6-phosphate isomerase-like protein (cupin superfamily)